MIFDVIREDKGKDLQVVLKIKVASDVIKKKRSAKLQEWSKKAKIDGFRPGKIPFQEIVRRFEKSAHGEVMQGLIEEGLQSAIKSEKVEPITQPKVNIVKSDIAEDLEFSVEFERSPSIELVDLEKIEVKRPVSEVPDKVVQEAADKVREQYTEFEQADKKSENGDQLTIDFKGKLDGEFFDGGSADDYKFVLGQGNMLPEFEKALVGKSKGDEVEFPLTFPNDYHASNLAGKLVSFNVKICSVAKGVLPELNSEFFEKLRCEPPTKEGFYNQVKQPLVAQLEQQIDAVVKVRVFDLLSDKHKFQIPESHIEEELKRLESAYKYSNQGKEIDNKEQKKLQKQAGNNVKLGFLLRYIIDEQNIELDQSLVDKELEKLSAAYEDPAVFIKWYREDKARMENIRGQVLESQVIDWVLSKVKIKEESVAYEKIAEILEKEQSR
jgi:trigger factor